MPRATGGWCIKHMPKTFTPWSSNSHRAYGQTFTVHHPDGTTQTADINAAKSFTVGLTNRSNSLTMAVRNGDLQWHTPGEAVDVSMLHNNNYKGFYAQRSALTTFGIGTAVVTRSTYTVL